MKKITKIIALVLALPLLGGCIGKFEEYNTNPYEPSKVAPYALLSEMWKIYANAQQNACQFNNTMWASFSGIVCETGIWGGKGFYYYAAPDNFNDGSWGDNFTKISNNLYQIEAMTQKEGPVYALAELTKVWSAHVLLSLYGPIPYSKATQGATRIEYDDEQTAWHAAFDDLDDAIAKLSPGVNVDLKDIDQFYHGDCGKWLKFANTLKLRMAIRISGKDPEYAKQKAEEAVASGVMEGISDSCWDTTNSGEPNGYYIVGGWGEVRANACITSCMNGFNDPRRPKYFTEQNVNWSGGYVGVRHGGISQAYHSTCGNYSNLQSAVNETAPTVVMYAAEAAFLRAEGALKGWVMGGTAKEFYEKGVKLSFEEFGVSGVDAYLANSSSKPAAYTDDLQTAAGSTGNNHPAMSDITIKWADDGRALERILTQKWIALYLDPLNGWADQRRTGFPNLFQSTKSDDPNVTVARGQRRLRFPQSEYNNNSENVQKAVTFLDGGKDTNGTDLWWALKSNGSY